MGTKRAASRRGGDEFRRTPRHGGAVARKGGTLSTTAGVGTRATRIRMGMHAHEDRQRGSGRKPGFGSSFPHKAKIYLLCNLFAKIRRSSRLVSCLRTLESSHNLVVQLGVEENLGAAGRIPTPIDSWQLQESKPQVAWRERLLRQIQRVEYFGLFDF
jgi:hypothetical protein